MRKKSESWSQLSTAGMQVQGANTSYCLYEPHGSGAGWVFDEYGQWRDLPFAIGFEIIAETEIRDEFKILPFSRR